MAIATILGFPRIGPDRELKRAVEAYWASKIAEPALLAVAAQLRADAWKMQRALGIDHIPSNDFSLYDQVLDTSTMVGAVPARFGHEGGPVGLDTYFSMARGTASAPAMEMTKWFDTNYHYIVPEFEAGQNFSRMSTKPLDDYREAKALGIQTRPVLLGPVSYLLLGKAKDGAGDPLLLLERLLSVYEGMLKDLAAEGAEWVQMDEPMLGVTLDSRARAALGEAYARLTAAAPSLKLLVAVYFSDLRDNLATALALPVAGLHVDVVRGPGQLDDILPKLGDKMLSVGIVDGRNVWRTDLGHALGILDHAVQAAGANRIMVATSCSLLHSPVDLSREKGEKGLDAEMRAWLAFAVQKVGEVATLAHALGDRASVAGPLADNAKAMQRRRSSSRIHDPKVKTRAAAVDAAMLHRANGFDDRKSIQHRVLGLPAFPTTTIGSFPQTQEIRKARQAHRKNEIDDTAYAQFLKGEIEGVIRFQEEMGLDVLVHGEPERNDMVEYFGEQLRGYAHTANGWVQSYGSRCVKPPIIFGDVSRPKPMTVDWTTYAQSLTDRPVKGMLTGPVTMLQWSFVRDDQPRSQTCQQLALAIRDEVRDLEAAGIRVIQIDEPAVREGLPLRREDWSEYLKWAGECFRLASSGVSDATQIHTHMCYAEFNDIIEAIGSLDADVISIESSRSDMELLNAFAVYRYPNEIGPGVYDIHSPRVPTMEEMCTLLTKATETLSPEQIWVNPDCGLKTRGWPEVRESLQHMVDAAKEIRARVGTPP